MLCQTCGNSISANDRFCAICGSRVSSNGLSSVVSREASHQLASERKGKYTFVAGDILYSENGEQYRIIEPIGRGGQGEVYRVSGLDGNFAIKWYHKDCLSRIEMEAFRKNLQKNVNSGAPSLSSGTMATQFIWPLKMMAEKDGSFGYLMNLFPDGYESFAHVVLGQKKDKRTGSCIPVLWNSWFARVTTALNIVNAFEILHSSGLSYQDINDGGFSVNMSNGDVFICDCDNVSPDGTNLGIRGMMTFMAPEVVRGEKLPDRYTDEFSLAVILFRLFMHGHPLEGEGSHKVQSDPSYSDKQAELQVFGYKPSYCLASVANSNPASDRFNSDVFRLSLSYPLVLMEAFEQVFTEGISNYTKRLTATEWRKILLDVRDHLVLVDNYEMFYGKRYDKPLPSECRILNYKNGSQVLCMPGKILYEYHFDCKSKDFTRPMGKVISSTKEGIIGLYNASNMDIEYSMSDKKGICNQNGRIPLLKGMNLRIGNTDITVS